jgi:mRNA interferase MazF
VSLPAPARRGEVFLADLDPVVGSEQSGRRPFLVLSIRQMNSTPAGLAIGLPMTTTDRSSKLHVRIDPTESGLSRVSYAMPEMVRSLSTLRFHKQVGRIPIEAVETASARAGFLLGLGRTRF